MSTIHKDDFDGLSNLTSASRDPNKTLAKILQDIADDFETVRLAQVGINAKIDADAGDTGGDNDYAATWDIATGDILTKKGRV